MRKEAAPYYRDVYMKTEIPVDSQHDLDSKFC